MSSFFSKDNFLPSLRRSARTRRTRKPSSSQKRARGSCPSTSLKGRPLGVIPELSEDEDIETYSPFEEDFAPSQSLYASSRHPTGIQTMGLRADPRPRTSSDVSIVDFEIERRGEARLSAYEFSIDDTLLMPPRSAPSPPISPSRSSPSSPAWEFSVPSSPAYVEALSGSPDSFRLTFSDMSLSFPHPPLPTPSTPSRQSTSPSSSSETLSVDSSPSSHNSDLPTTPTSSDDEFAIPPSPILRTRPKRASIRPLFIVKSSTAVLGDSDDSDDIPRYEASQFKLPAEKLQEEKKSWSDDEVSSDAESDYDAVNEWYNQQFQDILSLCSSTSATFPSNNLMPARPDSILSLSPLPITPVKSTSGRKPLPQIPAVLVPSPQLDPSFPRRKRTIMPAPRPPVPTRAPPPPPVTVKPRPPPRMSVPVDMDFVLEEEDEEFWVDVHGDAASQSTASIYSQDLESPESVDVAFDLDMDLRLPLSLPTSPVDLEMEFMSGLEQLALSQAHTQPMALSPTKSSVLKPIQESPMEASIPETPAARMYQGHGTHSPRRTHTPRHTQYHRDSELQTQQAQETERILRSRWSSSTLSSIDHHQPPPSASSRLKFYFGAVGSRKGRAGKNLSISSSRSPGPMSPMFPSTPSPLFSPSPSKKEFASTAARGRMSTDTLGDERRVRRSASRSSTNTSASSDCGSCDSAGSTSSGLRRKPIPVEMFIKC